MPLTDAQHEALADNYMIGLYQELERDVIQDIARRVKKTGRLTETAELMAKSMKEQGFSTDKIYSAVMKALRADPAYQKEVAENTKAYKAEVMQAIRETNAASKEAVSEMTEECANMSFNADLSMWNQAGQDLSKPNQMSQIVTAAKASTNETLRNLTKTTGFKGTQLGTVGVQAAYQRALDLALLKVATGTFSFDEACNEAVRRLAQSGLRTIDYKSGRTYQLDTAVRMAVRTGNHQLSGKVSEANCKATGQDLVITSQHIGARPSHAAVQNKVFSLSGKSKKYPCFSDPLPAEGGTGAGYGSAGGIMGVNCRHAFYPFFEGISQIPEDLKEPDPVTINGKEYTYYEATQKQRAMEREIRALKREAYATDDPEEARALRRQAAAKSAEYRDFSQQAGIRPKDNRLRVVDSETNPTRHRSMTKRTMASPLGVVSEIEKRTTGKVLNKSQKQDLLEYASKYRFNLYGINKFDGDVDLLKAQMDTLNSYRDSFPRIFRGKRITIKFADLGDGTYAMTDGKIITYNKYYLRDRVETEKDLADGGLFANATVEGISKHEFGHIVEAIYGEKGLKFAQEAYYNIFKKQPTFDELRNYIISDVSYYAYPEVVDEITGKSSISDHEITSEILSSSKESEFISWMKKRWAEEGKK